MTLKEMSREALDKLYEERKRALLEVRDEIDRRDRDEVLRSGGVEFNFEQYVTK